MSEVRAPSGFERQWIQCFTELGAFWKHDGNPLRPHALLTAKDDDRTHSEGFFGWDIVAQHPDCESRVAEDLAAKMPLALFGGLHVDRVIGRGSGAITLASRLAECTTQLQNYECLTTFVDKATGNLRIPIKPGERILACEDTISSGGSVQRTIDVAEAAGGIVLPVIAAVCNRSGDAHVGERRIIPLINVPMRRWTLEECPLCKMGSHAIKPKQGDNWSLLHQPY